MRGSPGAICPLVGGGPIDFDWARHVEVGVWWQKKGLEEPSPRVLGARAFERGCGCTARVAVWRGCTFPLLLFYVTSSAQLLFNDATRHLCWT